MVFMAADFLPAPRPALAVSSDPCGSLTRAARRRARRLRPRCRLERNSLLEMRPPPCLAPRVDAPASGRLPDIAATRVDMAVQTDDLEDSGGSNFWPCPFWDASWPWWGCDVPQLQDLRALSDGEAAVLTNSDFCGPPGLLLPFYLPAPQTNPAVPPVEAVPALQTTPTTASARAAVETMAHLIAPAAVALSNPLLELSSNSWHQSQPECQYGSNTTTCTLYCSSCRCELANLSCPACHFCIHCSRSFGNTQMVGHSGASSSDIDWDQDLSNDGNSSSNISLHGVVTCDLCCRAVPREPIAGYIHSERFCQECAQFLSDDEFPGSTAECPAEVEGDFYLCQNCYTEVFGTSPKHTVLEDAPPPPGWSARRCEMCNADAALHFTSTHEEPSRDSEGTVACESCDATCSRLRDLHGIQVCIPCFEACSLDSGSGA